MVADTARRQSSADGLRPLSLARDWRQVIELIEVAFGKALDAEARRALHSMRLPPLLAPLIGLLDSLSPPGEGMMPGYVWVEDGRVVGTASVRRLHSYSHGWLISNVAVHPVWQGRGIGRALLEAAVGFARDHGGAWVVLQVRDDNQVARQLYESLSFHTIGQVIRLRRATLEEVPEVGARVLPLRPARWSDGGALFRLARTLTPYDMLWTDVMNRDLYRVGLPGRLAARLQGYRRRWWVDDTLGRRLKAAVGVEMNPRNPWHRLRLLILPQAQDEQLASDLVAFGLAQLADAHSLPVEIEHPASDKATQSALTRAGFESLFALIHMRLGLK